MSHAGLGLPAQLLGGVRAVSVQVRPSAVRSSFGLDEVDVELADGRRLELVRKRLGAAGLLDGARDVKPAFLVDPMREVDVYRTLLAGAGLGTPGFHGAVIEPAAGRHWLFLERVRGPALPDVGDLEQWERAASWLGAMHRQLGATARAGTGPASLLRYDAESLRRWLRRARAAPGSSSALAWLAPRHEVVVERLAALPTTLVHGDYHASNVLIDARTTPARVAAVDWELAGLGPGVLDLAALVSGDWSEEERRRMCVAYRQGAGDAGLETLAALVEQVAWARLQLCVQWLGWAPGWSPPREQRRDWLGEALALAEELGL